MESSFGRRLFRKFLLFSAIPVLLLATVGYYLVAKMPGDVGTFSAADSTKLSAFYDSLVYDQIDRAMKDFTTGSAKPLSVDFVIVALNDSISTVTQSVGVPPEVASGIVDAAIADSRRIIMIDSLAYRFALRVDQNTLVIGGIIHPPSFLNLMQAVQVGRAGQSLTGQLRLNYLYFVGFLLAAVSILTAAAAYYFSARISRNLSQPLADLNRAAVQIGQGDFSQQVKLQGIGEIRSLTQEFNRMAGQLEATTDRLTQSERVAAWRHVARLFAHELKNPLQPLLISLHRIEKTLANSPHKEQVVAPLSAASDELKRLTVLADRFSQLAKMPDPSPVSTDLTALLRSFATLYSEQLSRYDFSLQLPDYSVNVELDEVYFRQSLHNLLQNALDATDSGGRIRIELVSRGDICFLSVTDSGHGMSEQTVATARMPYFSTKEKGSGIGLAVVEKVVSDLKGRLSISSKPEEGTTVTVELPLCRKDADAVDNSDS
ncbi:MAG: ATP-binding protein [Candidatus Zixiibacteriota bacterium]